MKRREKDSSDGNNNMQESSNPKRSRSKQNGENINPNIQNQNATNDVQVKGIFNRFFDGISNIPTKKDVVSTHTENGPLSSANRTHEIPGKLRNTIIIS